jgi:hypothetical protein
LHCATLSGYPFEADADDIRGATLFGERGQQLGIVDDVVFEHSTGEIRYLVVEYGHQRRVLVPLDRVFRAASDEDSFSSAMTCEDLDHLPAFEDKVLNNDRQWHDYEKLHSMSMQDRATAPEPMKNRSNVTRIDDQSQRVAGASAVAGFGPKWSRFVERLKRDLTSIRGRCNRCEERDARAA